MTLSENRILESSINTTDQKRIITDSIKFEETNTIQIISSMATRQVISDLIQLFEKKSKYKVKLESVGGVNAKNRVEAGEPFDIVILASSALNNLIVSGKVVSDSKVNIVKSGIAIAVSEHSQAIDISNERAVKQAVLNANSIGYSTGPSGTYLIDLFGRWGILEQIQERLVQAPAGIPVGGLVANREIDIGFQQLSELLQLEGIKILGSLPEEIQKMTCFSAGIIENSKHTESVKELLDFFISPEVNEIKIKNGMELT